MMIEAESTDLQDKLTTQKTKRGALHLDATRHAASCAQHDRSLSSKPPLPEPGNQNIISEKVEAIAETTKTHIMQIFGRSRSLAAYRRMAGSQTSAQ